MKEFKLQRENGSIIYLKNFTLMGSKNLFSAGEHTATNFIHFIFTLQRVGAGQGIDTW
jgi:hypothetical protein